jgi:Flp pilus assembly protein TadG
MRGAAAVEFAIVVPVLLLIVLGVIDWGYYFYMESIIANCAREAARAGAIAPSGDEDANATTALNDALAAANLDSTRAVLTTTNNATSFTARLTYPVGSITGASFLIAVPANALGIAEMRH